MIFFFDPAGGLAPAGSKHEILKSYTFFKKYYNIRLKTLV